MRNRVKVDWISGVLIGLFLFIQSCALWVASLTVSTAPSESGGSTASSTQATALLSAGEIILLAAVEISLILFLYRGYKKLPERWQYRVRTVIRYSLYSVLYVIGFLFAYAYGIEYVYLLGMPIAYVFFSKVKALLSSNGLKWIAFNLVAVFIGIITVTIGGLNLSPRLVVVIMVAFLVYDYIAVTLTDIMGDFVQLSSSTRFPNFLIVPTQLRVDLATIHNYIEGNREDRPEELAVMIGLGDFIFPSVLVVSVFVAAEATLSLPLFTTVVGLCLSVFVLRASLDRADEGLPALPYLCTGSIIGYVTGLALVA